MRGSLLTGVLLAVLILAFASPSFSQTELTAAATCRGDIDEDGRVTVFDLLEMLKILSSPADKPERARRIADVDASGRVDVFDLLGLLKYLSGSATPPLIRWEPSITGVSATVVSAGDTLDIRLSNVPASQNQEAVTVLIDEREVPLFFFSPDLLRILVPEWFAGGDIRVVVESDTTDPVACALGTLPDSTAVIFLHHSTGSNVWNGGVPGWFTQYNQEKDKSYRITERAFPSETPYGWNNYPYDYWNIWVLHAGSLAYKTEPTLEMLTPQYRVIVFKHCYPVSGIGPDNGSPNVAGQDKTLENYKLQYAALKEKLHQFKANRFIVWTGAALVAGETNADEGARARQFFDWVKSEWDEPGDNIFIWDFFELETEGGVFLKPEYSAGDSHPNESFCRTVAPLLGRRIADVIEGRGDNGSLTGK